MISRRDFLQSSATATAGTLLASNALSQTASSKTSSLPVLKIGLIGCGGRGTGAASNALKADPAVQLTAVGDLFPEHVEKSLGELRKRMADKVAVTPATTFIGFDAFEKVLASGVDVVILATPPGFRPQHLRAAIEAGKHVFAEKPFAVDGPGVRSVLETAKLAQQKKLSLVSGFCWRYNAAERELMARIHQGDIGEIRSLYTCYNTGTLWQKPREPKWSDLEYQIRNWLYYSWLSGDHINEQAVHSLDKMAWAMKDVPPLSCYAHGGRQVRVQPEFGHIFDHFSVVYEYPNDVKAFHFCRQQAGCVSANADQFVGSKGTASIKAFGPLKITGEKAWDLRSREGLDDMYQVEHNEMFRALRAGQPRNDGTWAAHSSLIAIMGRMAAYTGQTITWQQALESEETHFPKNITWSTVVPVPPVALPGTTKFA